jgi:hypothetical protein
VKFAAVHPYLNEGKAADIVAAHFGEPVTLARVQVARLEQIEIQAGF